MDDDQQFCLRWNNHQSTLVAVFDTLLENGTLVDCTLAAEGKFLNAHKVVLSACSPYFESLLSRHFDKHPILILKDVKFQELKAMMDYMYRGEVNISQDQLGALLKAAESLQIKGLSDNRKGETERKPTPAPPPPKSPQQTSALPKVQGLTIEQRSRDDSREGSLSPGPRKKKRLRRKSEELDNHDASNSSESHSLPAQNIPSSLPAVSKINADVPEPVETKSEILRHKQPDDIPQVPIIKEKIETHTELMLEPKSEYVEEMNEDSIEDLTLDDDDLSNMEQMEDQAGPSHGNAGEGSSQGFGGWHMGNQSQDEVFLAAQEAVGAHRDSQGNRRCQSDPLLVSRIKNKTGASICTYPVISAVKSVATNQETQVRTAQEKPKPVEVQRLVKVSRSEMIAKLRHKYLTERNQTIMVSEANGKLSIVLRCVLCKLFVGKGERYCRRCKDYMKTGIKPGRSDLKKKDTPLIINQCKKCSVFIKSGTTYCMKCENAQKKIEKESKVSRKVESLEGNVSNEMTLTKEVDITNVNVLLNPETVTNKRKDKTALQISKNIENIKMEDDDGARITVFRTHLDDINYHSVTVDNSKYYFSINDVKELDEESEDSS